MTEQQEQARKLYEALERQMPNPFEPIVVLEEGWLKLVQRYVEVRPKPHTVYWMRLNELRDMDQKFWNGFVGIAKETFRTDTSSNYGIHPMHQLWTIPMAWMIFNVREAPNAQPRELMVGGGCLRELLPLISQARIELRDSDNPDLESLRCAWRMEGSSVVRDQPYSH